VIDLQWINTILHFIFLFLLYQLKKQDRCMTWVARDHCCMPRGLDDRCCPGCMRTHVPAASACLCLPACRADLKAKLQTGRASGWKVKTTLQLNDGDGTRRLDRPAGRRTVRRSRFTRTATAIDSTVSASRRRPSRRERAHGRLVGYLASWWS
jgi:hypothetical protein